MKILKILLALISILSAGMSVAQSPAGNALSLDGNDDHLKVMHIPELQFDSSLTISVWMKTTTINNSSIIMQYECGNSCASSPSLYQVGLLDQRIHFSLRDPNSIIVRAIDTLNFHNDGNWHLVTGVRDLRDTTQLLYVDGVLVATEIAPDNIIGDDDGEDDPVVFGGKYEAGGPSIQGFFNGEVDEIRIWNIARTQEQIIATMNDTLGIEYYSTADSGLVGYWRFDEYEDLGVNGGGADDIRDFSVNNNHADAEGLPSLVSSGALVSVEKIDNLLLDKYVLLQNFPNPFNPTSRIEFTIPKSEFVTLKVYNILGEEVATLVSERLSAGQYKYDWDASRLAGGVYLYRIQAGEFVESKKMILLQ